MPSSQGYAEVDNAISNRAASLVQLLLTSELQHAAIVMSSSSRPIARKALLIACSDLSAAVAQGRLLKLASSYLKILTENAVADAEAVAEAAEEAAEEAAIAAGAEALAAEEAAEIAAKIAAKIVADHAACRRSLHRLAVFLKRMQRSAEKAVLQAAAARTRRARQEVVAKAALAANTERSVRGRALAAQRRKARRYNAKRASYEKAAEARAWADYVRIEMMKPKRKGGSHPHPEEDRKDGSHPPPRPSGASMEPKPKVESHPLPRSPVAAKEAPRLSDLPVTPQLPKGDVADCTAGAAGEAVAPPILCASGCGELASFHCSTCKSLGVANQLASFCSDACYLSSKDKHKTVHDLAKMARMHGAFVAAAPAPALFVSEPAANTGEAASMTSPLPAAAIQPPPSVSPGSPAAPKQAPLSSPAALAASALPPNLRQLSGPSILCERPRCLKKATLACKICKTLGVHPKHSVFCSKECLESVSHEHEPLHDTARALKADRAAHEAKSVAYKE